MRLYAIGDLHIGHKQNRDALSALQPHPGDGLILCGDIGENSEHLCIAFGATTKRFQHVFWVPGNHELYTMPTSAQPKGVAKYQECVHLARSYGIHTPEDEYFKWDGDGGPCIIAPIFTLYDYSFRPAHVSREQALTWAEEEDIIATDEILLHPDPFSSRDAWCEHLVTRTEQRLHEAAATGLPLIIINHWPLREDLVFIPQVPRFSLWCGTKKTEEWHTRFNAKVVVNGHLHVRRTDWKDGVRFEECSLGYPGQWADAKERGLDINDLLREILPGPPAPESGSTNTLWRRYG
jgi:predicted phosphodiesterase